jgi:hypothetical protein
MIRYHNGYRDYMQGEIPELDHDIYLGPEVQEVYNTPFWYEFIVKAEERLRDVGAVPRGVADGDLKLPGCIYASLRNEAFVKVPRSVAHGDAYVDDTAATVPDYTDQQTPPEKTDTNKENLKQENKNKKFDPRAAAEEGSEEENDLHQPVAEKVTEKSHKEECDDDEENMDYKSPPLSPDALHESNPYPTNSATTTQQRMVYAYPPNCTGWNAAKHPNPMLELLFFLRQRELLQLQLQEAQAQVQAAKEAHAHQARPKGEGGGLPVSYQTCFPFLVTS